MQDQCSTYSATAPRHPIIETTIGTEQKTTVKPLTRLTLGPALSGQFKEVIGLGSMDDRSGPK